MNVIKIKGTQLIPMASLAKFWILMFYCYFHSFLYQMCIWYFHLQLEILTLRLSIAFLAKSMVNPHSLDLVSEFWLYTF